MEDRDTSIIHQFRRYGAWLIFVPALLVSTAVSWGVHNVIVQGYGRMVSVGVEGFISEAYTQSSPASNDPAAVERLDKIIKSRIRQGALASVELVDPSGRLLYSSTQDSLGQIVPTGEAESRALKEGTVTTDIRIGRQGRQLHIVAPVTALNSKEPVAVMRVMRPYAAVAQSVRGTVLAVFGTILVGAAVAYALLWYLMSQTERELQSHEEQLSQLNSRLASSLKDIERHGIGTLQALNAAVDAKDSYTSRHSLNVADYACAIARQMGLDDRVHTIEKAGLLHDIGKIGVSEQIIGKVGTLTPQEYEQVKEHSRIGASIIEMLPFLSDIVPTVLHHHERWDGNGYPDGLSGEQIPLEARILAVADAFDAMTTNRPYRPPMSMNEATRELLAGRGKQFDPAIVDAFVTAIEDRSLRWLGDGPMVRATA